MRLIAWILNRAERIFGNASADQETLPGLTIQLKVQSEEVTDAEFAAIKAARKQKAKEWVALGRNEQRKRMIEKLRAGAEFKRKRAIAIGITHYVWLWPGVPVCDIGMRNNGKTFSYLDPPKEGHPCEGKCHAKDWCRCSTKSIVKGFS
jgi:hypothetical protein